MQEKLKCIQKVQMQIRGVGIGKMSVRHCILNHSILFAKTQASGRLGTITIRIVGFIFCSCLNVRVS